MLCLGERRHFDAFSVELMGFWVARGIVQYQKNFKRQSITPKVLPEFRDEALMTPTQQRFLLSGLLVVQPKDWQMVFIISLEGSGLAALEVRGVMIICTKTWQHLHKIIEVASFCHKSWSSLPFFTNLCTLWQIPQNRALSSALKPVWTDLFSPQWFFF